jgi:hypothetical protein
LILGNGSKNSLEEFKQCTTFNLHVQKIMYAFWMCDECRKIFKFL